MPAVMAISSMAVRESVVEMHKMSLPCPVHKLDRQAQCFSQGFTVHYPATFDTSQNRCERHLPGILPNCGCDIGALALEPLKANQGPTLPVSHASSDWNEVCHGHCNEVRTSEEGWGIATCEGRSRILGPAQAAGSCTMRGLRIGPVLTLCERADHVWNAPRRPPRAT